MKWFTKRAQLISDDKMYPAISKVLVGFIDELKTEGKVKLWYTSLKNNDGQPSFRVYLQIEEHDEQSVQAEFQAFMQKTQAELGWTGQFIEPDPGTPDSYPRLLEINKACELVLKFNKQFPESDRKMNHKFWTDIKAEYNSILGSVEETHRPEFRHFVANNLAMPDDSFLKVLQQV